MYSLKQSHNNFFRSQATKSLYFRKEQLKKLKKLIYQHYNEISEALKLDLRKSEFESISSEILPVIEEINLFCRKLSRWEKPKKASKTMTTSDGQGWVIRKPFGTCLIISPWNYPFQLALIPIVAAIGGGNCVIVKPSEITPNVSKIIAKIFNNHFPENYIKVIEGGIDETQALLSAGFDKIFFTGSPQVGKIVMQKAAETLSDVTLELGGKSPTIIESIDSKKMASVLKRILWGKFINSGQTCVSPDYILIHESLEEIFLEELPKVMKHFENERKDHPLISHTHFQRLKEYLSQGQIIHGGNYDASNNTMNLTIMKVNNLDTPIMKEEIFGPILPYVVYKTKENAVDMINQICAYPLALYVFTKNSSIGNYFLDRISFGGSAINDTISQLLVHDLPFGGMRTSGLGSYHGKYSYDAFTRACGVFKKSLSWELPFRYPPYVKKIKLLRFILGVKKLLS